MVTQPKEYICCTFFLDIPYKQRYYYSVSNKISNVRQNLFAFAAAASKGERVEFDYKGTTIRLVADLKASKLSRIEPLDILAKGTSFEDLDAALKQVHATEMTNWDNRPL